MNAAVLHALGKPPRFEQFPEPISGEAERWLGVALLHSSRQSILLHFGEVSIGQQDAIQCAV
jgi:hypothetical protein